ncbi:MAG: helicase C-terminal domain-containing protein [bacterium]|nr:helicase C-terminal domain-containing protein [bacterium]
MNDTIEVAEYLHPEAAEAIREAVRKAAGNEVFFIGTTDEDLIVREARVRARGDEGSVPAVVRDARPGDVIIHNHPDGDLVPSAADLSIASNMGSAGVGFYIVDNEVESIYPVVEPSRREELKPLDGERLLRYILPGGDVSAALPDYEFREEQRAMMEEVIRAFNEDRVAMVEAGTGTGKSLAYLIPAIAWSLRNRERVVVSTNTINLQEQLTGRDIPLLQRLEGLRCSAVLVKGRGNYLCLRKLGAAREELLVQQEEGAGELEEIARWAGRTGDGSLADLSFIPKGETWERVAAEADQCTRARCPHYARCFFYRARRAASSADLLVVNHHLLMADLAVRSRTDTYDRPAVLPRFHRVIADEAQHLENVATEYLGFRVSRFGLLKILRRLQSGRESGRGLLPFLRARLAAAAGARGEAAEALRLIDDRILPERHVLEERLNAAMERAVEEMTRFLGESGAGGERVLRVTPEVRQSGFWRSALCPLLEELAAGLSPFAGRLRELAGVLGRLPERLKGTIESPCLELVALRRRLQQHLECLAAFTGEEDGSCRWLEVREWRGGSSLALCAAPVDVSAGLRDALYDRFGTVLLTSATLTVGGRFDYFRGRLGIEGLPSERLSTRLLPSPFDFRSQAFVACPRGIPEPDSPGFEEMLERIIGEAVRISRGRAFVLFTSYRLLGEIHRRLEPVIGARGITPLRQGSGSRTALLDRFREEEAAVLFATDSFWEGVDVKGEALQCVIITRLPFRVPNEPIQQARMEAIEAAGGDPFLQYSVPQAVIKFRQGFGRLIRHRDDVGAVLVLDARIHTKRYGRLFLESLPDVPVCALDEGGALAGMERFFAGVRGTAGRKKGRGH